MKQSLITVLYTVIVAKSATGQLKINCTQIMQLQVQDLVEIDKIKGWKAKIQELVS